MTLIAAFTVNNIPVILGDIMISNPVHGGDVEISMPSVSDVNKLISSQTRLRVVGLTQKVNLVSGQVCIAWSGSFVHARLFLKYMRRHCNAKRLSLAEYNRIIDGYPGEDLEDISIISYFHDGHGFGRRYLNAPLFDLDGFTDLQAAGSGTTAFIQSLEDLAGSMLSGESSAMADAIRPAVSFTSHAFGSQIVTGEGAIEGWGGAFEIAYPVSDRFVKVRDVLHLTWIVHDSEQGDFSAECIPYFVKLAYKGERMIVFVADFREDSKGDSLYVVDPVYGINDTPAIEPPTMEYTWLANHFHFGTGERPCYSRVDYFGSEERPIVVQLNGREAIFSFKENYLRKLFEAVNSATSTS
jgi:hypothetical protein